LGKKWNLGEAGDDQAALKLTKTVTVPNVTARFLGFRLIQLT
jgi:hypothetical protein